MLHIYSERESVQRNYLKAHSQLLQRPQMSAPTAGDNSSASAEHTALSMGGDGAAAAAQNRVDIEWMRLDFFIADHYRYGSPCIAPICFAVLNTGLWLTRLLLQPAIWPQELSREAHPHIDQMHPQLCAQGHSGTPHAHALALHIVTSCCCRCQYSPNSSRASTPVSC